MRIFGHRTLTAVSVAAAVTAIASAPADASFPGRNGRIAYADSYARVAWTARPDGTGVRRISGKRRYPQWSADGRSLIFLRYGGVIWRSRPNGTNATEIFDPRLVPASGSGPWRAREAAFSPDGRRVLYSADVGHGGGNRTSSLFTVATDGSDVRRIFDGGAGLQSATWSPDGSLIAFRSGVGSIATIRPDGTGFRVRLASRSTVVSNLDFSPGGRRLLYVADCMGAPCRPAHIKILTLRTGAVRAITPKRTGLVTDAVWTPDGTRIAYLHYPPVPQTQDAIPLRRDRIYTIRPNGTGKRLQFALPPPRRRLFDHDHFSWQPRP